jgi:hypothetical protein
VQATNVFDQSGSGLQKPVSVSSQIEDPIKVVANVANAIKSIITSKRTDVLKSPAARVQNANPNL